MGNECTGEFVMIEYRGPVGNHIVYSPMRRVRNYGMHTYGDKFCVDVADITAAPRTFVVVAATPEVVATPLVAVPPPPVVEVAVAETDTAIDEIVAAAPAPAPEEPAKKKVKKEKDHE